MALPFHALNLLAPIIREKEVLSLGYPDITASAQEIERLFGYKPTKFTNANKWHGVKDGLPETLELFEKIGSKLTIVDSIALTGHERVADLNYPQDLGKFDLVIDPGTLEHCFNIGQAWLNAANAVKTGGMIFHLSPMTMLNHGFYNLCPTVFYDFYKQNGWEIREMKAIPTFAPNVRLTDRFDMSIEHILRTLVVRKTDNALKFPMQTKYLKNEVPV